jgi:uncharacterized 2Fe-2S/4Fe-4S cluster protein (DUF4445 family)
MRTRRTGREEFGSTIRFPPFSVPSIQEQTKNLPARFWFVVPCVLFAAPAHYDILETGKRLLEKDDLKIEFQPLGRRGESREGESIMDCARRLGLRMNFLCGGTGTCSTCRIRLLSGVVSELTAPEKEQLSAEEISAGWRLACQVYPRSACAIHVPAESLTASQRLQLEGQKVSGVPEPPVTSYAFELPPPALSDLQADGERLIAYLNKRYPLDCRAFAFPLLQDLSNHLRSRDWKGRAAVRQDEIVAVSPLSSRDIGLAVDLGTTKIAGYLMDLQDGTVLASAGIMNPQIGFGEDVITRITFALSSPASRAELKRVVIDGLNGLAGQLCDQAGVARNSILEAVVVGNTAMHHLFLGLPVGQLALAPFVPSVSSSLDVRMSDVGLGLTPGGYVHLLPNIAGFVGADHVAALAAVLPGLSETPAVVIDIGTNTEVSLVEENRLTAVSCASGPAFEGGHIRHGMRAAAGAIERVRIHGEGVECRTVNQAPPLGICGSGIVDAVAQLYRAGVINETGRMEPGHTRVTRGRQGPEFILIDAPEPGNAAIAVTQKDVREVQLAKAAVRSGIQALLETHGVREEEIKTVIIAGAFGNYIDVESAMDVGMLPCLDRGRFRQIGNAAGTGARLALISVRERERAREIASRVHYLELASTRNFTENFSEANYLGRYRLSGGKRTPV